MTGFVRRDVFKAHVATDDYFQVMFPKIFEGRKISKRPVMVASRGHESNANIYIAIRTRLTIRAATKKPKLLNIAVCLGPRS